MWAEVVDLDCDGHVVLVEEYCLSPDYRGLLIRLLHLRCVVRD
jgi:hypothetical protein